MSEPHDESVEIGAALAERYRILKRLGAGATATVYLADDLRHDRRVAIKVLRTGLAAMLGPDRFLQEIRVTAGLHHPHITPLYDSGEAGGRLYFVMPAVEDQSLRERLTHHQQLDVDEALRLTCDLAGALDYAHEQNVVHRDIKPENILLHRGNAQLADFGIAGAIERAGGERLTSTGVSMGTPAYMSPEQAAGDRATGPRTDIYSLAAVLYEMLAGDPPFTGASVQAIVTKVLVETARPLSEVRADVPRSVDAAVARALSKAPGDRFASAGEFAAALSAGAASAERQTMLTDRPVTPRFSTRRAMALAAVVVGLTALWLGTRVSPEAWLRHEAIPEIERLAMAGEREAAWTLAKKASDRVPGDPDLAELVATFTFAPSLTSDPQGARIWRKAYGAGDDAWELLGTTPVARAVMPQGASLLRVELDGHRPVIAIKDGSNPVQFTLDPHARLPDDMVRVAGWREDIGGETVAFPDFFIDRFEVTNTQFRRFVDAGGYRDPRYWRHPFVLDGRTVTWAEAMARFTDQTGRPGPSTWQVGTFADGLAEHPVSGVSWHEAAAYASFVGRSLPTAYHWLRAHRADWWNFGGYVLPASNVGGPGLMPVGASGGVGPSGAFDMAGNVREWVFNDSQGMRAILGGAWNDPEYLAMGDRYAQGGFDRSSTNGLRLAQYAEGDPSLPRAMAPLTLPVVTDFLRAEGPSISELAAYGRIFDYDRAPLEEKVEEVRHARHWTRETISFTTAYGGERMTLYLFMPLNAHGKPQVLVHWPGSGALNLPSFDAASTAQFDFLIQSGRAVAVPVLAGTYERRDQTSPSRFASNLWRDRSVRNVKDIRRTLDYLETRSDLDAGRVAYHGFSWGAAVAPLVLSQEPRLKAAVLYVPGFWRERPRPEADPLTFVRAVSIPVLMISGRLDYAFPLETHARPFFELLGTPAAHKRHVISEGGHFVPRPQLIRESLDWLDRYLGPVAVR